MSPRTGPTEGKFSWWRDCPDVKEGSLIYDEIIHNKICRTLSHAAYIIFLSRSSLWNANKKVIRTYGESFRANLLTTKKYNVNNKPRLWLCRVGHGLDPSMDWIGLDWIGSDDCNPLFFSIYIFSILTTDKRWRCKTIMCILADFNRLWLDCKFYKTLRLGSIALWHPFILRLLKDRMLSVVVDRWVSVV